MIRLPSSVRLPAREQLSDRGDGARTGPDGPAGGEETTLAAAPIWRVHIPTVEESCVRVRCRQAAGSGP